MSADTRKHDRPLLIERDGAVETLVINDAPRNRMGLEFMDALEAEVARLVDDPGVRAVVIRGAGEENFSVGMDLKQLPKGVARMGSLLSIFDGGFGRTGNQGNNGCAGNDDPHDFPPVAHMPMFSGSGRNQAQCWWALRSCCCRLLVG